MSKQLSTQNGDEYPVLSEPNVVVPVQGGALSEAPEADKSILDPDVDTAHDTHRSAHPVNSGNEFSCNNIDKSAHPVNSGNESSSNDIDKPAGQTVIDDIIIEPSGSHCEYTQYYARSHMPKLILADDINPTPRTESWYNDYYISRSLIDLSNTEDEESSAAKVAAYILRHDKLYNVPKEEFDHVDNLFSMNPLAIIYTLVTLLLIMTLAFFSGNVLCQILAAIIFGTHLFIITLSEPESMNTYVSLYWLLTIGSGSGLEYIFDEVKFRFDPFYKKLSNLFTHCRPLAHWFFSLLKLAKKGGAYCLFMQKIRKNVSSKSLHHVNLKGINLRKSHSRFPTPNTNKIPIRFKQGLPFVSIEIQGLIVDTLLDTGCQFNILNKQIYDKLINKGCEFEHFTHGINLANHSGGELNLCDKAARIPVKFLSDSTTSGSEQHIPFLIENNPSSTNILGMRALHELELEFGPGFQYLNLKTSKNIEAPPKGWIADDKSVFSGKISVSCDPESMSPKLEASFEGLNGYTGCIVLESMTGTSASLINGTILHLTNGTASYELDNHLMDKFPLERAIFGRIATCTENCPSDDICLAADVLSGEPVHYRIDDDNLLVEVEHINNLRTWLCQEDLLPEILNPGKPDPSVTGLQNDTDPDPPEIDTDPSVIDLNKFTSPDWNNLSRADLEVNVTDAHGACLLCSADCRCSPSNLKDVIIKNRVPGKIYTCNNKLILCLNSVDDIMTNIKKLGSAIVHYVSDKKFRSVRLGNKIKESPGLSITLALFDTINNISKSNPNVNITLYKTISSGSVHELQFNVQNGQLEHRPELLSRSVGLSEDLLNPSEIKVLNESYEDDLKEVIKESSPDLHKFLFTVFSNYSESYISSPYDFGCLKHPDFRLDLKLKEGCEHLLPRHAPFHANAHMCRIVDKICEHWASIDLVAPSNITSHCSRLIIVHKKVSVRNFENIRSEIESSSGYRFKTNLPSELYSVDPDLLSVKQITKIYRVCLDSRDLNRICTDSVQRSQNPEICLQNLQTRLGSTDHTPDNTTDLDQLRISDPYASYDFNYTESDSGLDNIKKEIENVNVVTPQRYYYSSIDISSAHTSVQLTDRAASYLNFITPSLRIMKFMRAIFGLKAISSTFNGSLTAILRDMVSAGHIYIYADDILVASRDIKTHLSIIAEISRRFARHGLKINLGKSKFGVQEFNYIGYNFTPEGIFLSEDRIEAITSFPRPTNKKAIQRLLGTLNFIQKCIPQFAFNVFPLMSLLGDKKFKWTQIHEDALNRIKEIVKENLPLHYVPDNTPLTLFVDSSAVAGGGVLFAGDPDSKDYRPVLYLSKKYSELEIRRNSALECEMTMLLYCLEKIQYFTNGTYPIRVKTDAKTLIYLLFGSRKTKNPKLGRLASKISEYLVMYDIQYEKPQIREMKIADCISRLYYNTVEKYPGDLVKLIDKSDITIPSPGLYSFQDLEKYVINTDCVNASKYLPQIRDSECSNIGEAVECDIDLDPYVVEAPGGSCPHDDSGPVSMEPAPHPEIVNNVFIRFHSINTTIPPTIDNLSWKNIVLQQQQDPIIKEIMNKFSPQDIIEENTIDNYAMIKGLLYKKVNDIKSNKYNIYIPETLLNLLISSSHIQFGHMGYVKLTELLSLHFFHPNLSKKTKNLISKCHLCTLSNPNCLKKQRIQAFRYASQPNETLGLDFMKVKKDNKFENILVVCDLFSGFTFLKPTVDQSAESVIKALKEVFEFAGAPNTIRSDGQMSLIKSKKVKTFFAENNIQGEIYPPNYAKHNPKTERTIRTIRELIRYSNVRDGNFRWYKNIKLFNTLLNSIPRKLTFKNRTHFLSPFEIYFGRKRPLFRVAESERFSNYNIRPSSIMNESIRDFARGALVALKADYIDKTNIKGRDSVIEVGDCYLTVNKQTPGQGQVPLKYRSRYNKNIYLAKKIIGKNVIGVDILTGISNYACIDNIKKIYSRDSYFSDLPANIKNEIGSELDLKLDLNSRRNILSKLKLLKMYTNVDSPVTTLKSDSSASDPTVNSGSSGLLPNSNQPAISVHKNLNITNSGNGLEPAGGLSEVHGGLSVGFPSKESKLSQNVTSLNPDPISSPSENTAPPDPTPPSVAHRSPGKMILNKGKKLKEKIVNTIQSGSATPDVTKNTRPKRIRNPNRPKNRNPDFVYDF